MAPTVDQKEEAMKANLLCVPVLPGLCGCKKDEPWGVMTDSRPRRGRGGRTQWMLIPPVAMLLAGCASDPGSYVPANFSYVRSDHRRWEEMTRPDPEVFGPRRCSKCGRCQTRGGGTWGFPYQAGNLLQPQTRGEIMRKLRQEKPGFQPSFNSPGLQR